MSNSSTHWDPASYSTNSDLQFAITMAVLASYRFNGNEAVLDVGCGDGRVSHQLSLRVPQGRVVGIDSSASIVEFARANHASQANLSFAFKDVCEPGYMKEFDVGVSTFCLQWVPDKAAANSYRIGETSGTFTSVTGLANLLGAVTPHLQRLPGEEDKRAFMEELVTRYLALMPSTQYNAGHTSYVYVCATMIATSG